MPTAYLALGANLGDRDASIRRALARLAQTDTIDCLCVAPVIETAPVGPEAQPPFLNTVCEIRTTLSPRALLETCQQIETDLGRAPVTEREPWGPRVIDLDIVLYGSVIVDEPGLTIPHPQMHRRRFVLEPLCAIAPETRHPVLDATAGELLARLHE